MLSNRSSAICGPLPCSLLAILVLVLVLLYKRTPIKAEHVAVIDCGSSGTRIYVFTWKYVRSRGGVPELELIPPSAASGLVPKKSGKSSYNRVETLPGIDAFADRPAEQLEALSLGPLLNWARAVIPQHQLPAVPIFLFATAGVRRMPEAKRHALMERAREVLRSSGFRFEPSWARIISGTDEGVYGWIAINYLRGFLDERTGAAAAAAIDAVRRASDAEANGGGGSGGGVAATLGRRGAAASALAANGAVVAAGVNALAEAVSSPTATVGSLDLGGSSLEMVYCAEAAPREEWRQQQRQQRLGRQEQAQQPRYRGQVEGEEEEEGAGHGAGSKQRLLRKLQRHLPHGEQAQRGHLHADQHHQALGALHAAGAGMGSGQHGHQAGGAQQSTGAAAAAAAAGGVSSTGPASSLPARELLLGPRAYSLRTHTFQRYGLNDAFDRSVSLLLLDALQPPPPPPPVDRKPPQPAPAVASTGDQQQQQQAGKASAQGGRGGQGGNEGQQLEQGERQGAQGDGLATRPQRPAMLRQDAQPPSSSPPVAVGITGVAASASRREGGGGGNGSIPASAGGAAGGSSGSAAAGGLGSGSVAAGGAGSGAAANSSTSTAETQGGAASGGGGGGLKPAVSGGQESQQRQQQQHTDGTSAHANRQAADGNGTAAEAARAMAAGSGATAGSGAEAAQRPQAAGSQAPAGDVGRNASAAGGRSFGVVAAEANGTSGNAGGSGGGGDSAAAKLRSQTAELEQQKRDSERIIQLVKEQLAAAQAHAGSGSGVGGSAGGGGSGGAGSKVSTAAAGSGGITAGAASDSAVVSANTAAGTSAAAAIDAAAAAAAAAAAVSRLTDVTGGDASVARSVSINGRGDVSAATTGAAGTTDAAAGRAAALRRLAEAGHGVADTAAALKATATAALESETGAAHVTQVLRDAAGGAAGAAGSAAASSSEEGLAVAAGLAAAAAARAAVLKAAADAGGGAGNAAGAGAGVVVVGRDDADVRGGGGSRVVVHHPCMHAGFSRPYVRTNPYGVLSDVSSVHLVGSPDWATCLALVTRTVNATAGCAAAHCVLGSPQPPLQGPFVALAGFYVVWTFFGLGSAATPGAVLSVAQEHCAAPWHDVEARLGAHINVEKYCLWGPYVAHLLTAGLGLSHGQFVVGSGDVGWPIGAALAEALRLPGMGPELPLLHRLAAALLPASWLPDNSGGGGTEESGEDGSAVEGAGDVEEGWPGGLGLGVSLTVLWAAFLLVFIAWCCLYAAARSWWGRPTLGSLAAAAAGIGVGVGRAGSSGQLLLPLAGRGRQSQQRLARAPWWT